MLPVCSIPQTSASQGQKHSISEVDRVVRVAADRTSLRLGFSLSLALRLPFFVGFPLLFFSLYPLSLGGGLHVLLQEIGIHGLDMWRIDVDQGSGALSFIAVHSANAGGPATQLLAA